MNLDNQIKNFLPSTAVPELHGRAVAWQARCEDMIRLCEDLYYEHELPLMIISATDEREEIGYFRIRYIFGIPRTNRFLAPYILVKKEFPSLTPRIHEASIYERKIKSFFGLEPCGHPNPRSLILHENWPADAFPLRKDFDWRSRPAEAEREFQFRRLGGEGIYEIPVGPVHAGVIEPGHFRFSVAGEEILLLEPRLGYSHKGSEKLFETLQLADKLKLAERISGDSSFSHALAFCLALEALAGLEVSRHDDYVRVVMSELERLANHLGDLGTIMMDTGYNFGGAQGSRMRESVMQLNERLTGSRFLRGVVMPGGVSARLDAQGAGEAAAFLDALERDFSETIVIAGRSKTLLDRLRGAGTLPVELAMDHGVRGVAGRAAGLEIDTRIDFQYSAYGKLQVDMATEKSSDVYARFQVRVREVHASIRIIRSALAWLGENSEGVSGSDTAAPGVSPSQAAEAIHGRLRNNSFAIGVVEGWRGELVHLVATDASGAISRVDVRDASFLNWTALGYAGQENMVPDFPLINKSFNLSYSGNDL